MIRFPVLLALAALGACGGAVAATTGPATPTTLAERLAAARGGETIRLAPGDYSAVTVPTPMTPR